MGKSVTAFLLPALDRVEQGFEIKAALDWMEKYWMLSVYGSILYLLLIYVGRQWMKNRPPFSLRKPLILWNCGLAIFSFCGMTGVLPNLISNIYHHGLVYTTCHSDCISQEYVHLAVWGWIFALSKLVEFGDTVFIVLRKSPLTFLHWYHHITVCVYTWYALTPTPSALSSWFGGMNYTVHTAMYTYYAFRSSGFKIHPFIAKCITILQLSQMFVGIFINLVSWRTARSGDTSCMFRYDLFYLAGAMYTSYAVLFLNFFYQRYIRKTTPKATPKVPHANGAALKTKQS